MRVERWRRAGVVLAAILLMQASPAPASAVTDWYPDLRMAVPTQFYIQTVGGQRRLRFTTFIRNAGAGPLVLLGRRADTSQATMAVRQRVYTSDGSAWTSLTPAVMRYARSEAASDGHNHWHTQRVASYELFRYTGEYWEPLDRLGRKTGFCFFDTDPFNRSLPRAPQSPVYRETCGGSASLTVRMGLSVGWSDKYPASFAWQWIDVTGLDPARRYRVCVTADDFGWFREVNDRNNHAWADVRWNASGSTVRVIATGFTRFGRFGAQCGDQPAQNRLRLQASYEASLTP